MSRFSLTDLFRDDDEFAWILRSIRALVVIGKQALDFKSASCQQVFGLKPKQMPHSKRMHQSLLAAIRMCDVVNQFNVAYLFSMVAGHDFDPANDSTAIGGCELRLFTLFLPRIVRDQGFQPRIEKVENQTTARD